MSSLCKTRIRLSEPTTMPKLGDIRLTSKGTRRQIFTGNSWQYLCSGDPNCLIRARFTCRIHRYSLKDISLDEPLSDETQKPKPGDIEISPDGTRRVWRSDRWSNLCREKDCLVRAKSFCAAHRRRMILSSNTNEESQSKTYQTESFTGNHQTDSEKNNSISSECKSSQSLENVQIFNTVTVSSPEKYELKTRNGRRVRCNESIWKYLYFKKKNGIDAHNNKPKKTILIKANNSTEISSDNPDFLKPIKSNKKRKIINEINDEEHIVPKRKSNQKHRKDSIKSTGLNLDTNSSISAIPSKENAVEEPVTNDSSIELSLKSSQNTSRRPSIEIPIQEPSSLDFDLSTSDLIEQFGVIIKKEVEEESLISSPPAVHTTKIESPCETLKDFLRLEELKKQDFLLDCQRISYCLAKIHDCISSLTN